MDLAERPASPGELRRFARKFGAQALVDRESKRFAELGLKTALLSEERWLDKLAAEPFILKQPLVRWQHELTIGAADDTWRAWATRAHNAS